MSAAGAAVTATVPAVAPATDAGTKSPADEPFVPAEDTAQSLLVMPSAAAIEVADANAVSGRTIGFLQIAVVGVALFSLVVLVRRRQRRRIGWGVLPERVHPARPAGLAAGGEDAAL